MTRKDQVLSTTTLERMVFSLTLTALLLGTQPGAAADTLDSPDMFPDGDTTEKFVTLGDLTATDTDIPPNGIDGAEFIIPGTVHWTFTWKVDTDWDITVPPANGDGAVDLVVSLKGEHLIPPPAHNHNPAVNTLPPVSSLRTRIRFDKKTWIAGGKVVRHGDHWDRYWFRYDPTALLTNNTPSLRGPAKVRAQHSRTGRRLFGTTSLRINPEESRISYDANLRLLSLFLGPIFGLDNQGGLTGGIDPEYVDDPILAGEVSVTSLEFLGQDDDGRYLFGGGEIEIVDPAEQFVFRGEYSEYVLDSTLPQPLEQALTNFADIDDLEISDVGDEEDGPSQFLDDFVERGMFGEDMPAEQSERLEGTIFSFETEQDLVLLTEGFTQSVFDVPVTVRIGGGFSLPCACNGDANQDGIVNDLDIDVVLNCQGAEPEEECEAADINCDDIVDEQDIEAVLCLLDGDDTLDCCPGEPESDCEGDANGDGDVNPLDSGFVLARFGCLVGIGDPDCDAADQNGDGNVDPLDSGFVLARFGDCP